jgi:hypothetical protein
VKGKLLGGIAGAAVVVCAGWAVSDTRTRTVLARPMGHTLTSDPFQTIGRPIADAGEHLQASGLHFYERKQGGQCLSQSYDENTTIYVFSDETWRRGTVCLVERDGLVTEVVWHFDPLAP